MEYFQNCKNFIQLIDLWRSMFLTHQKTGKHSKKRIRVKWGKAGHLRKNWFSDNWKAF
jgi:hypothetical protein